MCQMVCAQTLDEDAISKKIELILDSLDVFQKKGDTQKVLSICENGIAFLSNNEFYATPASCHLLLTAGKASMNMKDYYSAKYYFLQSFVLDELGEFGIGSYTEISKKSETDGELYYFMELLNLAKADSAYMNMIVKDPDEFGYRLNSVALDEKNKGNYSSAIYYFQIELNLLEALGKTGNEDYLSIIPLEIMCLQGTGNYELALAQADYNLKLVELYRGNNNTLYAEALQKKGSVLDDSGKSEDALKMYNESLSLIESIKGKNNMDYIRCLEKIGRVYHNIDDNPARQLEVTLEAETLLASASDATLLDKVGVFSSLSHLYSQMGDKAKSLIYAERAVSEFEKEGEIHNAQYASQLATLCSAYTTDNSYTKAIETGEKAVLAFSQIERTVEENILYRQTISGLSKAYFESGDIDKAISTIQPLLTNEFPDDIYKISDFQRMATYYQRAGSQKLMKESCEASLELAEKIGGKNSGIYADALMYVSTVQEKKGDAIMMIEEAAKIYLEKYGENSESYINTQKVLALYSEDKDNTKEKQESVLTQYENLYGKNSRRHFNEYLNYIETCSNQYKDNKDVKQLYQTYQQLDSLALIIGNSFSKKDELYLNAQNNLAKIAIDCYKLTSDSRFYDTAVRIQEEVVSIASSMYGVNNIKYINEVENLAQTKSAICSLYYLINYEESRKISDLCFSDTGGKSAWEYYESTSFHKYNAEVQELQRSAIDYYIKLGDKESANYAHACEKLANYYANEIRNSPFDKLLLQILSPSNVVSNKVNSTKDEAEKLYKKALDIYRDYQDLNASKDVLSSMYFLYEAVNDDAKSANALAESFQLQKQETIKQLSLMTSEEKSQMVHDDFWNSQIDHYNTTAYYKSMKKDYNNKYAELAYDSQLLSKGLLLKSEIGLRDLIYETGNKDLIDNYTKLVNLQKTISESKDEATKKTLRKEYQLQERQLMKQSEVFGDYLHDFSYSFNDVKDKLGKEDIAIEFATMRFPAKDDNDKFKWERRVFALVLKHDYSSPKIVRLKENIHSDSIYHDVWEPLIDEIKGMKNVYFSPTYDLHNLPLETAVLPDGTNLSDLGINFYRVSSTREIIKPHKKAEYDSMKLYGGLKYDMAIDALSDANLEYQLEESEQQELFAYTKRSSRNVIKQTRFDELKWTLKEIQEIEGIAKSHNRKCEVITGEQGTEESLRTINGKKYGLLHFSTHGFYWTEEEAEDHASDKKLAFLMIGDNQPRQHEEDKAMTRSGLIFSGANIALRGKELPEGMEDGIATAQEISHLDLRGCDLVVLSACQTGLGEVSGEGVFGLQRGFKKAGVNSILMSLWEVNDRATQMLMVEFYKHYLAGESKLESLRKAQQHVKSQPGFEAPVYWAGFILLDGLNMK